jgi:hypothetical protein
MRRTGHLILALMTVVLAGCGGAAVTETQPGASGPTAAPPVHDVAIVIPEAEEGRVTAGTIVELIYPGGESRGYRHFLQRWDGQAWTDAYQVIVSDPDQPYDEERVERAWAQADEERTEPSLGFEGSEGGQYTVIPPPATPGTYRICDEVRALCSAEFKVADSTPVGM